MADWKKVIVSGSSPEFLNIINDGAVAATHLTGSFTGSFSGDGSNLTGLSSGAVTTYTGAANNRILTSVDSSTINGEVNLSFNDSINLLTLLGEMSMTGIFRAISGSFLGLSAADIIALQGTVTLPNVVAGEDNTVLVLNSSGEIVTDEIHSRVWGTELVITDGSGDSDRLTFFSDTDEIAGSPNLTFSSNVLTVNGSTFGQDVVVDGDLTVNGTTFSVNVANVEVEDRFILLNSGSAAGDGGIIVQTEAGFSGSAFGWDDSATRFAIQKSTALGSIATSLTPDMFMVGVVDIDNGHSDVADVQQNGNIKVDSGDVYIYA